MIGLMRKKLPKKSFKKEWELGKKYFWLSLLLVILLIGFFGGRWGHSSYRAWEKRRDDRAVAEIVEEKNRILEEILKIYGGHVDLGNEDLGAMLAVIEEGILKTEKIRIEKGEEIGALLREDLGVLGGFLEELELLVEYFLKIQPCYKRFEASISNLLAKETGMILKTENYLEEKRKLAEVDFEVCGKIEAGKYEDAQAKFLVILEDYAEFLKKGNWAVGAGSEFRYSQAVNEYREKIKKEMEVFESAVNLNNLPFFKEAFLEMERLDGEILNNLKLKTLLRPFDSAQGYGGQA
jgi:hypothetical protein